jgi:hypothetical protein
LPDPVQSDGWTDGQTTATTATNTFLNMRLKDKGKTKDDESKGGKPHAEVLSGIPTYRIRSNPMDGQMDKELERTLPKAKNVT